MMWYTFNRLTNSRAVCFVDIYVIAAIMVEGRSKVPTFKTFGSKGKLLMFLHHGALARWDEGRSIKVELAKEGVEG